MVYVDVLCSFCGTNHPVRRGRHDLMNLQVGLLRREGQTVHHETVHLVHGKENLYEWIGHYQDREIVRARFKKGWSVITASDIFIDYEFLRNERLTLAKDKKEIAGQINSMIYDIVKIG